MLFVRFHDKLKIELHSLMSTKLDKIKHILKNRINQEVINQKQDELYRVDQELKSKNLQLRAMNEGISKLSQSKSIRYNLDESS